MVRQHVLPFKLLEATDDTITSQAGLVLFGEFLQSMNHKEIPAWVVDWYDQRGEASENRIEERKTGFGMERMPSGNTKANAVFFRIGVLASNLFLLFRRPILDERFQRAQVQTVRWKVYRVAGKIVRHAGALVLKVAEDCPASFRTLRERCLRLWCREGSS